MAVPYAPNRCDECGTALIFATTIKGKQMPLDADPNVGGNVLLTRRGDGEPIATVLTKASLTDERNHFAERGNRLHMPHFATCTNPQRFARSKPTPSTTRIPETEQGFQDAVVHYATIRKWLSYHTLRSKGSNPGFPDLVLVRAERLVFIELKRQGRQRSPEQVEWATALAVAGQEVYCWEPIDWPTIERILK